MGYFNEKELPALLAQGILQKKICLMGYIRIQKSIKIFSRNEVLKQALKCEAIFAKQKLFTQGKFFPLAL